MSCGCECTCKCDCCCSDDDECCNPALRIPRPCGPLPLSTFLGNFAFPIVGPVRLSVGGLGPVGPSFAAIDAAALITVLNTVVIPALITGGLTVHGVFSLDGTGTQIIVPLIGSPPTHASCAQLLVSAL